MTKKRDGIETREDALAKMVELAADATRLATVLAERDEEVARINELFADRIETASKLVLALKAELKDWAKEHREECEKDTQTIRFHGTGEIQIRTGNPEVRLARGIEEQQAIQNLFDQGMGGFVRTVQELNREDIIAERENGKLVSMFQTCGISVRQSENVLFTIEGVGKV